MLAVGALSLSMLGGATAAHADDSQHQKLTCSGASLQFPGVIAPGTYDSITVSGVCLIPGGSVHVDRNLVVTSGSLLLANFPAFGPGLPAGDADVSVGGNVLVGNGAALVMGCAPSFGCAITTNDVISGNLVADEPLGVIVHGTTVRGNVVETGGGGGVTCDPVGVFTQIGLPAFSAYDDSSIGGNFTVTGLRSCWFGAARVRVGGSAIFTNNNLADPDAIEILSNNISGNLVCEANSMMWNSFEASEALFPRVPAPNTVGGKRIGQCVLASPTTPGGPLGPGPF